MALQRYLATREISSALRSFRINVCGVILVIGLLSGIGLTMFVFYHFHPDPTLPSEADKIYPHFIATQLPAGVSGLVLAAILAATMSAMTSGINAISSTITLDLLPRIAGPISPTQQLRFARICSSVVGIVATILAGFVHRLGTLFDLTQIILGVFAGPLLVVVVLATARSRVPSGGVIAGLIAGCIAGWCVAFSPIASLWTAPVAALSTLVIAHLFPGAPVKVPSTT
jgi:solute:Na+ symporter, SSS family